MFQAIMTEPYKKKATDYLNSAGVAYQLLNQTNEDEIIPLIGDEIEMMLIRRTYIGEKTFAARPNLKVISKPAAGYDSIDVDAATRYGVAVVHAPGANAKTVAEFAVMSAMICCKKIFQMHPIMATGDFAGARQVTEGMALYDHPILVVGFGNIGKRVCKIFTSMDCRMMVYDPYASREEVKQMGYQWVERLEDALPVADVVTIHVPLTPETENLIAAKDLALMKPTAVVVNDARGGIINELDLAKALNDGVIAGAAIDVFSTEPLPKDHPLYAAKNVILSPHMAGHSPESLADQHLLGCINAVKVLQGDYTPVVNPEALRHAKWSK